MEDSWRLSPQGHQPPKVESTGHAGTLNAGDEAGCTRGTEAATGRAEKDRSQLRRPPPPTYNGSPRTFPASRVGPPLPSVFWGGCLKRERAVGFFLRQTQAPKLESDQGK